MSPPAGRDVLGIAGEKSPALPVAPRTTPGVVTDGDPPGGVAVVCGPWFTTSPSTRGAGGGATGNAEIGRAEASPGRGVEAAAGERGPAAESTWPRLVASGAVTGSGELSAAPTSAAGEARSPRVVLTLETGFESSGSVAAPADRADRRRRIAPAMTAAHRDEWPGESKGWSGLGFEHGVAGRSNAPQTLPTKSSHQPLLVVYPAQDVIRSAAPRDGRRAGRGPGRPRRAPPPARPR